MIQTAYEILKEHNLRVTPQRKAIIHILYNCKGHHLETQNIYEIITVKKISTIGIATVYRTMELFEKIGLVSKLKIEKLPARYELTVNDKPTHHHLICLKCGRIKEIDDDTLKDFKNKILQEKDFVTAKPIKIYGYCDSCKK